MGFLSFIRNLFGFSNTRKVESLPVVQSPVLEEKVELFVQNTEVTESMLAPETFIVNGLSTKVEEPMEIVEEPKKTAKEIKAKIKKSPETVNEVKESKPRRKRSDQKISEKKPRTRKNTKKGE